MVEYKNTTFLWGVHSLAQINRTFPLILIVLCLLALFGCTDQNQNAPTEGQNLPFVTPSPETGPSDVAVIPETQPTVHYHAYDATVIPPGCVENGYTLYRCACGEEHTGNEVTAYGHKWSGWTVVSAPTEEKSGSRQRHCTVCLTTESESLDPLSHQHTYRLQITEPTCIEDGYTNYFCSCGSSYVSDHTKQLGHDWSQWETVTEPTCQNEGLRQRKCARCREEESEVLEKLQPPDISGKLTVLSFAEVVHRNETVSLTISGTPGVEYDIDVYYSSGESKAKGLENQIADTQGVVTWTWKIGGKTAFGTYQVVISGGGESQTVYFTVA